MSLIIGAAGAVGKRIINALTARGDHVVAALRSTPLPDHLQCNVAKQVMDVDVRSIDSIRQLFSENKEIHTVWSLVEPSASTEAPTEVTVSGMKNILQAMTEFRVNKLMFMDGIASFGPHAPRADVSASWLAKNVEQDPGCEYGVQKRKCRELMKEFSEKHGADTRFAILPVVLHSEGRWGNSVLEYPLQAFKAAVDGETMTCPVSPDVKLPMIFADDLARGLIDLMETPGNMLFEPEKGYCMSSFSCTPTELFAEIRKHEPDFEAKFQVDPEADKFARMWPDSLSNNESARDFGYRARFTLETTVNRILRAHRARKLPHAYTAELTSLDSPLLS